MVCALCACRCLIATIGRNPVPRRVSEAESSSHPRSSDNVDGHFRQRAPPLRRLVRKVGLACPPRVRCNGRKVGSSLFLLLPWPTGGSMGLGGFGSAASRGDYYYYLCDPGAHRGDARRECGGIGSTDAHGVEPFTGVPRSLATPPCYGRGDARRDPRTHK